MKTKKELSFIKLFTLLLIILTLFTINFSNLEKLDSSKNVIQFNKCNSSLDYNEISYSTRESYSYHNYSELVDDLKNLNTTYPGLIELYNAQNKYGLPDCKNGYKIWFVRITNESLSFNKPEVFFVGGHHGNEPISIEAPYYLIEFLLKNYESNDFIRYLLDHREIYVMPVVNPWGWENNERNDFNSEDVNRDYPYGNSLSNEPLTTVGAQAVTEIMKNHIFILSLSWHSGEQLIYYAWGTPIHDTISDESPDNLAFFEIAKQMSENANGNTKYPYGPANQMFYFGGVRGAWSDYAYAAAWDTDNVTAGHVNSGAKSLAFGIEISNTKKPDENKLGNPNEVFETTKKITSFIPQNIRMALVMIDLAEPYLTWRNFGNYSIPDQVTGGSTLNLSWYVNGSISVTKTRILYGLNPDPITNYDESSPEQSGDSHWSGEYFEQKINLPKAPGDYYFVAHAKVDQNTNVQNYPEPDISPQSFYVNQRIDDSWEVSIDSNSLQGSTDWYSDIIHIKVVTKQKNHAWISDYDKHAYCNEPFNITWKVITNGTINHTELYWGQNQDPINNSENISVPQSGKDGVFSETVILSQKPGYYYFVVRLNVIEKLGNNTILTQDLWSQILEIEIIPRKPYKLIVTLPEIEYYGGYQQELSIKGVTCSNMLISNQDLDSSSMVVNKANIYRFDPKNNRYLIGVECDKQVFDLEWSDENKYWYLPIQNISEWSEGWYQIVCEFMHMYGEGKSNNQINTNISNWFKLNHIIIVNKPIVEYKNESYLLNISSVNAWCSKVQINFLNPGEVNESVYYIKELRNENIVITGNLSWNSTLENWDALNIDISNMNPGNYFIVCIFSITEIGESSSFHNIGDETEFEISPQKIDAGEDDKKDKGKFLNDLLLIILLLIIFLMIFLLFLIFIIRIRKHK